MNQDPETLENHCLITAYIPHKTCWWNWEKRLNNIINIKWETSYMNAGIPVGLESRAKTNGCTLFFFLAGRPYKYIICIFCVQAGRLYRNIMCIFFVQAGRLYRNIMCIFFVQAGRPYRNIICIFFVQAGRPYRNHSNLKPQSDTVWGVEAWWLVQSWSWKWIQSNLTWKTKKYSEN